MTTRQQRWNDAHRGGKHRRECTSCGRMVGASGQRWPAPHTDQHGHPCTAPSELQTQATGLEDTFHDEHPDFDR